MSFAFRRYHPIVGIAVVSITSGIAVALVWLGVRGDGHVPPPLEPWGYTAVHVCPSAAWTRDALEQARARYLEACVEVPELALDPCDGPPAAGVAQVRDHRDQVLGWNVAVGGHYIDRIAHRHGSAVPSTAVAYVLEPGAVRDCTPAHVLGHLAGYREHATAATSVMSDPCGPAFHHLDACP